MVTWVGSRIPLVSLSKLLLEFPSGISKERYSRAFCQSYFRHFTCISSEISDDNCSVNSEGACFVNAFRVSSGIYLADSLEMFPKYPPGVPGVFKEILPKV